MHITSCNGRKHSFTQFGLHGWDVVGVASGFMVPSVELKMNIPSRKPSKGGEGRTLSSLDQSFSSCSPRDDQK